LKRWLAITVCMCLTASIACAGSRSPRRVDVKLSNEGRISVEGQYTGIKGMVKAIKKLKADKRTTIYVEIPENTSPAAMKQISSKLASQSFGRMIFTKPRKFLLEDSTTAAKKAAAVDSQSTK
jgi:hypothetical protein